MLDGGFGRAITSTFIVDEAVTLLRARGARRSDAGVLLGMLGLKDDEGLPTVARIVDVTAGDLPSVVALQDRFWDRGLSFTDCSSLRVMEREGVETMATFDRGFEGLVRVENGGD